MSKHRCLVLIPVAISVVIVGACAGREFRSEVETIAHFTTHRADFERVMELFAQQQYSTVIIPEKPGNEVETPLVTLSRQLRITKISSVPSVKSRNEQWIEFTLAQRFMTSYYGVLYVPPDHGRALASVNSFTQVLPETMQAIRPIGHGWFYFDYK